MVVWLSSEDCSSLWFVLWWSKDSNSSRFELFPW